MSEKIFKRIGNYPEFRTKDTINHIAKELVDVIVYQKDYNKVLYIEKELKEESFPLSSITIGNRYDDYETYEVSKTGVKMGKKFISINKQIANLLIGFYCLYVKQIIDNIKKTIPEILEDMEKERDEHVSVAYSILTLYDTKQSSTKFDGELAKYLSDITKDYIDKKQILSYACKAFAHFIQKIGIFISDMAYFDKKSYTAKTILGIINGIMHMSGNQIDPVSVRHVVQYVESQIKIPKKVEQKKEPNIVDTPINKREKTGRKMKD